MIPTIAALFAAFLLSLAPTPVEPSPEPVEIVQTVTAEGESADLTRDPIVVTPAPPVEVAAPAPLPTVEPVLCEPGWTLAEDGSCVNPGFYDDVEASSIGPFYDLAPCTSDGPAESENCYWDAIERGNGVGTDFIQLNGVVYTP